jgi:hypothetical protein
MHKTDFQQFSRLIFGNKPSSGWFRLMLFSRVEQKCSFAVIETGLNLLKVHIVLMAQFIADIVAYIQGDFVFLRHY